MKSEQVKIGDIFGRLVVIEGPWMAKKGSQMASKVKVQCSCGGPNRYKEVFVNQLRGKGKYKTVSCGCLKAEKASERTIIRNTTHGMSQHGLYSQYNAMMSRCYRPEFNQYKDYGGRGITVCDEWKSNFIHFAQWALRNGWVQGLTIERINNNEGYSPTNCKWATRVEQANNKRTNRRLEAFGRTQTIAQWAKDRQYNTLDIPYHVLYDRVTKLGWSIKSALLSPVRPLTPTT